MMNNKQYRYWCMLIYGNVPLDYDWAIGTQVWKDKYQGDDSNT